MHQKELHLRKNEIQSKIDCSDSTRIGN